MSVYNKVTNNVADAVSKIMNETKEEVKQIDEYKSVDGSYKHKGTYGTAKGVEYGETDYDKEDKLAKGLVKKKKGAYGPNQNRRTNTKLYTEMLNAFKTGGIKGLFESIQSGKIIVEEPTEDEFNAELEKAKAKASGKAKQADVAKASVQAVQNEETETEIEVLDLNDINGVKESEIVAEKTLTAGETAEKERIVKGMKKGIEGFKDRYGDKAKEVMYATATSRAKKD